MKFNHVYKVPVRWESLKEIDRHSQQEGSLLEGIGGRGGGRGGESHNRGSSGVEFYAQKPQGGEAGQWSS